MRKINPADVHSDFAEQLLELGNFYDSGMAKFSGKELSTFVANCMLGLAVAWEGFVNDMIVAYINRNSTRFKEHLENAMKEHFGQSPKPKKVFEEFARLKFPNHLTKKQVQDYTDDEGSNITFSNFKKLEDKAKIWLSEDDARKFTDLSSSHKAIVDAVIALRNHIAHRSERSSKNVNDKLSRGELYNSGLKRGKNKVSSIGAWLKSKPPNGQNSRFSIFLDSLQDIGRAVSP